VYIWWEWFPAKILDVRPTELIAVKNRSHNDIKLFSGCRKVSFLIRLAASWPAGPLKPAAVSTSHPVNQSTSQLIN
jgi:hypothetical protein